MMKKPLLISALLLVALLVGAVGMSVSAQTGVVWNAQFYDNPFLSDPPVLEKTVDKIEYEWFFGSPDPLVPVDNFSIRFGTDTFFNAGTYRFSVQADDLVRLSIDERSIIDTFGGGQTGQVLTADVTLAGVHHLQVDYREVEGLALVKVSWQNVLDIGKPTPGAPAATVLANTLNVRDFPATVGTNVLTKINRGQVYGVVARLADSSWWQINVNGVNGWVFGQLVSVANGAAVPIVSPSAPTVTVTQPVASPTGFTATTLTNLRLRADPRVSGNNTLTTIPRGTQVAIVGRNATASWLQVNFDGQVGWVSAAFTSITPPLILNLVPVNG
jgi:uncharacterized protein YraI